MDSEWNCVGARAGTNRHCRMHVDAAEQPRRHCRFERTTTEQGRNNVLPGATKTVALDKEVAELRHAVQPARKEDQLVVAKTETLQFLQLDEARWQVVEANAIGRERPESAEVENPVGQVLHGVARDVKLLERDASTDRVRKAFPDCSWRGRGRADWW